MPRGVKGSGPKAAKRAYKKRAQKTNSTKADDVKINLEINNPMNELLSTLTELLKEALIALKRDNAKYAPVVPVVPVAPAAAPAEPEAPVVEEPKRGRKPKATPAPAPAPAVDEDPFGSLADDAPAEMTPEESQAKTKEIVLAYLGKIGREKGVPAAQGILKNTFKVAKTAELSHEQRVKFIAILQDAIDAA